jgi:hypothetical protein
MGIRAKRSRSGAISFDFRSMKDTTDAPRLAPNPVYAELHAAAGSAAKNKRQKPVVAAKLTAVSTCHCFHW